MANVGKNIRKLREGQKMTQDALAEQLHVTRQTVSNYETGRSNPDIDMLIRIAEIFGTDVNMLIYGPPLPPDRKRDYRKLLAAGIAAVILGLVSVRLYPTALELRWKRYDSTLFIVLHAVLLPGLYLLLGWMLMQAAGIFVGAGKLKGRAVPWIHRILWGVLLLYVVIIVPKLGEFAVESIRMAQARAARESYSMGDGRWLPAAWDYISGRILFSSALNKTPPLFALWGIFLWITGKRKE